MSLPIIFFLSTLSFIFQLYKYALLPGECRHMRVPMFGNFRGDGGWKCENPLQLANSFFGPVATVYWFRYERCDALDDPGQLHLWQSIFRN